MVYQKNENIMSTRGAYMEMRFMDIGFSGSKALIPTSNISRYVRYVQDLRVIVVDRDPRDIYLMEKG